VGHSNERIVSQAGDLLTNWATIIFGGNSRFFPYSLCFSTSYLSPKYFLANVEWRESARMKYVTSHLSLIQVTSGDAGRNRK